jgi:2-polyprenyl-3-methyl-5-hydroxy-6-metoxy-1,4-benzoquinol methylase
MKLTEKEFLEAQLKMGICYSNPKFKRLAENTYNQIKGIEFKTVLDYGCGLGTYSQVLLDNGVKVTAQDIFKEHRDYVKKHHPDLKVVAKPIKADLMYFIETAEHMTDEEIVKAIETIDPKFILFSSTSKKTDKDYEWGHVNIKPQTEWITFWESMGYKVKQPLKYPTSWTMLLERI